MAKRGLPGRGGGGGPQDGDGARIGEALPLSRVDFLILLVLTDGDLHGYGIVKVMEERSGGTVRLLPGNLYGVVDRLMDGGLVTRSDPAAAPDLGQRKRRYYSITPLGRQVLAAEAAQMHALVREAAARDLLKAEAEG